MERLLQDYFTNSATIIAFITQEGGVGKPTLASALARDASKGGLSTKIADLDIQQGTLVE